MYLFLVCVFWFVSSECVEEEASNIESFVWKSKDLPKMSHFEFSRLSFILLHLFLFQRKHIMSSKCQMPTEGRSTWVFRILAALRIYFDD